MKIVHWRAAVVTALACAAWVHPAVGGVEMKLTSPAFKDQGMIPRKFTCQGEDINPALSIEGVPPGAKGLVLVMDDPDAPVGTWTHWILYNIPVTSGIAENNAPGLQGTNSWGRADYGGPCPPSGTHRYFFRLYALDAELSLGGGADPEALSEAMEGHVLDTAELVGLYRKS